MTGLDAAALIHDIEYEKGNQWEADNNMYQNLMKEYPYIPQIANFTRLSLLVKDLIGYKPKINSRLYQPMKEQAIKNKLLQGYRSKFLDDKL